MTRSQEFDDPDLQRRANDATVVTARLETTVASNHLPTWKRDELLAAVTPAGGDGSTTTGTD